MTNFYQKNLRALSQYHPDLAKQIISSPDLPALSMVELESGESAIQLNFNDGSSSSYYEGSPLRYSENLVSRLELKNPRILIFLGLGLGHHVLEYLKNPHPVNQHIVIVEAFPQVFKMALEHVDLSGALANQNISWFAGSDVEAIKKFFADFFSKTKRLKLANAIEYVPLPTAVNMSAQFFKTVETVVQQAIGHQFNRYFSDPYDGYRGTANVLENLSELLTMPVLDRNSQVFAKQSGVVIASGPSLTQAIPYLKQIQDKVVLAACPSALSLLIKNGIYPHVWVHTERDADLDQIFEPHKKETSHLFVVPPMVHPRCFKAQSGINVCLPSALYADWLPLSGQGVSYGHSSAHAAFKTLELLGCDSIFLVGQDLSYHQESSHASDVWDESVQMMSQIKSSGHKVFEVEGNNGGRVQLNVFWHTYLRSFVEELIPNYQGKVFNVISQDMGAKISGAQRIDPVELPKLVSQHHTHPFETLSKLFSRVDDETLTKRKCLLESRVLEALTALQRVVSDNEAFALKTKAAQFGYEIATRNWQRAKPVYLNFNDQVETFFGRFYQNSDYESDRFHYEKLFFNVVQGMILRYFIDYYSSSADLNGDFAEINRKLEILFHQAKDQAFWAKQVYDLLDEVKTTFSF